MYASIRLNRLTLLALSALLLSVPVMVAAQSTTTIRAPSELNLAAEHPMFEHDPRPGGIALVDLGPALVSSTPKAYWGETEVAVLKHQDRQLAAIGIPLATSPGAQAVRRINPDGSEASFPFTITGHAYNEQRLTITNRRKVNPAPVDMVRIRKENQRLRTVKSSRADRLLASSFIWPVPGPISSTFGLKRFLNDQPRRPHAGIDIAAPEGTTIMAAADGVVIEAGDYFFNGNSVFIEHGLGLQSLYAHLSRIDVKNGQRVYQGDVIGEVGATGRVTGPHLHWSIGLNGTWVDPLLLVDTDQPPQ